MSGRFVLLLVPTFAIAATVLIVACELLERRDQNNRERASPEDHASEPASNWSASGDDLVAVLR